MDIWGIDYCLSLIVHLSVHGWCVWGWGFVEKKETEGGTEETFSSHSFVSRKGEVQFVS